MTATVTGRTAGLGGAIDGMTGRTGCRTTVGVRMIREMLSRVESSMRARGTTWAAAEAEADEAEADEDKRDWCELTWLRSCWRRSRALSMSAVVLAFFDTAEATGTTWAVDDWRVRSMAELSRFPVAVPPRNEGVGSVSESDPLSLSRSNVCGMLAGGTLS